MCDEVNLPSILLQSLKNQVEMAKLLDSIVSASANGRLELWSSSAGVSFSNLLHACEQTEKHFAKFLAGYQIQIEKRTSKPGKCS